MHECIWLTFVSLPQCPISLDLLAYAAMKHYTRLYIYAFAFQAHVQRNTSTTQDGKKVADNVIFPRGPMGSPDARFILEAIDAAVRSFFPCLALGCMH